MKKANFNTLFIAILVLCGIASFVWMMQSGNPSESRERGHLFLFQEDEDEKERLAMQAYEFTAAGIEEYEAKNYEAALENFTKAAKLDKKSQTAYYGCGSVLNDMGRFEEAVVYLKKAAKMEGSYGAEINNSAGYSYFALKKYAKAEKFFKQALKDGKYLAPVYCNIGNSLFEQGKYEEAMENYNKSLENNPESSWAYAGLGNSLYELGQYEESIKSFNSAIELNAAYAGTYNSRGVSLVKVGRYKEAVDDFQSFMIIYPQATNVAMYNLTEAYILLDNLSEALKCLEEYVKTDNSIFSDDYKLWVSALEKSGDRKAAGQIIDFINKKLVQEKREDRKSKGVSLTKLLS